MTASYKPFDVRTGFTGATGFTGFTGGTGYTGTTGFTGATGDFDWPLTLMHAAYSKLACMQFTLSATCFFHAGLHAPRLLCHGMQDSLASPETLGSLAPLASPAALVRKWQLLSLHRDLVCKMFSHSAVEDPFGEYWQQPIIVCEQVSLEVPVSLVLPETLALPVPPVPLASREPPDSLEAQVCASIMMLPYTQNLKSSLPICAAVAGC